MKREYRDATLGNSWLMMENCDRPQTPWIAVIAGSGNTPQTAHLLSGPVIHAGSRVFVYKTEADVHIHLSGTVLEGGVPGATVHVRVLPQGAVLTGVVQGADSIELTRPPMVLVSEGTR